MLWTWRFDLTLVDWWPNLAGKCCHCKVSLTLSSLVNKFHIYLKFTLFTFKTVLNENKDKAGNTTTHISIFKTCLTKPMLFQYAYQPKTFIVHIYLLSIIIFIADCCQTFYQANIIFLAPFPLIINPSLPIVPSCEVFN